jgi:hypothetical protein
MIRRHKYSIAISQVDLEMRLEELRYFQNAALEPGSRAALNSVVKCYVEFCNSAGLTAFPLSFRSMGLYYIQYAHHFGNTTRSVPVSLPFARNTRLPYSCQG